VFQENIPNVGTLPAIPLCSTNSVGLVVGHLYIKNTGGVGQPPLTEVDYNWNLPDGWAEYGTGNTGSITTSLNFLTIVPISSKGGTVSVKGTVNTSSCTATSPSNTASIVINRTPTVSITPPIGYIGAACGVVDPITFSVNTVSCATKYEWILPQGWSGTSSTNTITITPSGSGGGQLKSIITLDIGTTVERIYNISFINSIANPTISSNNNNSEICHGESYDYICTPPNGYPIYYGFDWYATGGLLINGTSYSLANPFHTTSN